MYPENEGIILLTLEHAQYSQSKPSCMFILGRDVENNRVRIRWYPQRKDVFGASIYQSPYFCANAPWLFAVLKEGKAMEMIGGLPVLGSIEEETDMVEFIQNDKIVETVVRESKELDASYEDIAQEETDDDINHIEFARDTPLDEVIKVIEGRNK